MTQTLAPDSHLTLQRDVAACRRCVLAGYLETANPIAPSAIEGSRILLVGQAPGTITNRKGYHFAGPSGRLLERWLAEAGFPPGFFRQHVFLTSLTRCFPGKARAGAGDRPPSAAEMALCRPFLDREFALVRPKLVILVGKMAIDALLGKQPLTETVGRSVERDGIVYLPLPHASGVSRWLNQPENQQRVRQALVELSRLRILLFPELA